MSSLWKTVLISAVVYLVMKNVVGGLFDSLFAPLKALITPSAK